MTPTDMFALGRPASPPSGAESPKSGKAGDDTSKSSIDFETELQASDAELQQDGPRRPSPANSHSHRAATVEVNAQPGEAPTLSTIGFAAMDAEKVSASAGDMPAPESPAVMPESPAVVPETLASAPETLAKEIPSSPAQGLGTETISQPGSVRSSAPDGTSRERNVPCAIAFGERADRTDQSAIRGCRNGMALDCKQRGDRRGIRWLQTERPDKRCQ